MNGTVLKRMTLCLGMISLLCLAAFFLALDDIYDDYASPALLEEYLIGPGTNLPERTACPLEWRIVRLGFWPMAAFHVVAMLGLLRGNKAA